jgi:hypothetical protein
MILKRISVALALAALVLGSAVALRYAEGLEIIGADAARRTMQVMIGLILVAYSNLMPKDIGPWRASASAAIRSQSALRVGGWALTLAGLGYALFWAFTPIPFAAVAGPVVVATALLITVTHSGWTLVTCRRQQA